MDSPHGAAVTAEDFGLEGPRGWAFRSVTVDAEPGSLIAVVGPSGSGRTSLLLALTGRMRPTEGSAEVAGLPLPRKMAAVRRISALGPVQGVSELDPALTVGEHLRERALLQRRFDASLRALLRPRAERAKEARDRVDEALEAAGLDTATLPKRERTSVRDLERLEALRLSVALALIGRPRLLAVDDADLKLSDADRAEAWRLLRSVAESGTTVLAVCSEAPEGATVVVGTGRGTDSPDDDAPDDDAPGDRQDDGIQDDGSTHEGPADDTTDGSADTRPTDGGATAGTHDDTGTDHAGTHDETTVVNTTEEGTADALAETGRA
ncbi:MULTISPECIES: ATP-binding cassette domain-containing protein [unclassified Streptomyces]|uniref:ATP-binding cassette domain-containing protein n=1 Tax=unclassified Streptomyces TaxID=2593676 RepID=UPI0028C3FA7F|nr:MULTISPECIES: ATP-binding cassette domain-containing protein [unclassified Streptomyces]WNO75097.1 ATP-binding cassette domain-containing protein [Streptomyces sp. AM8-1-1]